MNAPQTFEMVRRVAKIIAAAKQSMVAGGVSSPREMGHTRAFLPSRSGCHSVQHRETFAEDLIVENSRTPQGMDMTTPRNYINDESFLADC